MERGLPITESHALWHSGVAAPVRVLLKVEVLCRRSMFSESLNCILIAAALSPPRTCHLVNYLNMNVSWFSLAHLHFSDNKYVCSCNLLIELAYGLSVLRYFWKLSELGGMVILVFPFKSGPLVHFLLCYFYFSCTSYTLSEASLFLYPCISSVSGSGMTKCTTYHQVDVS